MAQTGRMSRVHDAHADSMYSPMSAKAEAWGVAEPPREMQAISPTLVHTKHPSPGFAQGRWSHHTGGSEQNTPLRSSFQKEEAGPGTGQVKDPNLHEQYFGVEDEGVDDLPGPSTGAATGYYTPDHPHPQHQVNEEERGHFI